MTRRLPQAREESFQVESGPTAEDGQVLSALDLRNCFGRQPHEFRRVESLSYVHHID